MRDGFSACASASPAPLKCSLFCASHDAIQGSYASCAPCCCGKGWLAGGRWEEEEDDDDDDDDTVVFDCGAGLIGKGACVCCTGAGFDWSCWMGIAIGVIGANCPICPERIALGIWPCQAFQNAPGFTAPTSIKILGGRVASKISVPVSEKSSIEKGGRHIPTVNWPTHMRGYWHCHSQGRIRRSLRSRDFVRMHFLKVSTDNNLGLFLADPRGHSAWSPKSIWRGNRGRASCCGDLTLILDLGRSHLYYSITNWTKKMILSPIVPSHVGAPKHWRGLVWCPDTFGPLGCMGISWVSGIVHLACVASDGGCRSILLQVVRVQVDVLKVAVRHVVSWSYLLLLNDGGQWQARRHAWRSGRETWRGHLSWRGFLWLLAHGGLTGGWASVVGWVVAVGWVAGGATSKLGGSRPSYLATFLWSPAQFCFPLPALDLALGHWSVACAPKQRWQLSNVVLHVTAGAVGALIKWSGRINLTLVSGQIGVVVLRRPVRLCVQIGWAGVIFRMWWSEVEFSVRVELLKLLPWMRLFLRWSLGRPLMMVGEAVDQVGHWTRACLIHGSILLSYFDKRHPFFGQLQEDVDWLAGIHSFHALTLSFQRARLQGRRSP